MNKSLMRNRVFIMSKVTSPPKDVNYKGKNGNFIVEMSVIYHLNQMIKMVSLVMRQNQSCTS